MFKKKPQIKTLSPLRSSDRRKLADRIISDLAIPVPRPEQAASDEEKATATGAVTQLRASILPDNSLSAKFVTTSGPTLREVSGTVYVGSHHGKEQRILWVSVNDRLYPSVYTLWHNPGIVPLLHTPAFVVKKLQGGADLMIPGLAGPPFPEKAAKGAIVAIASLEQETVPMVVGTCEIDISALQQTQGAKGRAVDIFHWFGDDLWDWSTSGKKGSSAPEYVEGWSNFITISTAVENLSLQDAEDVEGGVPLDSETVDRLTQSNGQGNTLDSAEQSQSHEEEIGLSTKEIDEAFRKAFLYGVHSQKANHSSQKNYGLTFPLGQSLFLSSLVQPYLPTFTPKRAEQLQMKKTSWKKAHKFIKSLEKEKLVMCKERPNNEVEIWDIDFDDRAFADFVPYELPRKETKGAPELITEAESQDDSIGQQLKVTVVYRPSDSLRPIFESAPNGVGGLYTAAEIRSVTTGYIERENLIPSSNKRQVQLNPTIANSVLSRSDPTEEEILRKGSVQRDVLVEKIIARCNPFHVVLRGNDALDSVTKPKPGLPPRVEIVIETRSGNKTTTRVHGLEPYFVDAQTLADELKKACAGSTSVEPYKAGKGLEVMVQGPQKDAVLRALDKRGIVAQWITVVDKTKGKKK